MLHKEGEMAKRKKIKDMTLEERRERMREYQRERYKSLTPEERQAKLERWRKQYKELPQEEKRRRIDAVIQRRRVKTEKIAADILVAANLLTAKLPKDDELAQIRIEAGQRIIRLANRLLLVKKWKKRKGERDE
jgi:hypothetical protein